MNLRNYVVAGLIAFMTLFSSCTEEVIERGDTIIYEGGNANITRINIEALSEDWKWNPETQRYEIFIEVDFFDKAIIDDAAVIAYWDDQGSKKNLPYTEEYRTATGETNSFRIAYDIVDYTMRFYIEESTMGRGPQPETKFFKVVIIEEFKK